MIFFFRLKYGKYCNIYFLCKKIMITIYHNPRCGKSRECLAFIENTNLEFEVVKYLDTPFTFETLSEIVHQLKVKPIELVRIKEAIWVKNYKNKNLSDNEIIEAMLQNPKLIERPIVVHDNKAVVARPLDKVKSILY